MKKALRSSFLTVLCVIAMLSCKQHKTADQAVASARPITVELSVSGMMCQGCVETVRSSIAQLQGVDSVNVSLDKSNAIVIFKPQLTDTLKIRKAVELNGYKITAKKIVTGDK